MSQIQSLFEDSSLFTLVVTSVFLTWIFEHISLVHQKKLQLRDSRLLSHNQGCIGCFPRCVSKIPKVTLLYDDIDLLDCSPQYLDVVVRKKD